MARRQIQTITTAAVSAGATLALDTAITGGSSEVDLLKLKITPSVIGDGNTTTVQFFHKATKIGADRFYHAKAFPGILYDPADVSTGSPIETAYGAPINADDEDETAQWHLKISNLGAVSKTYAVHLEYANAGGGLGGLGTLQTPAETPDETIPVTVFTFASSWAVLWVNGILQEDGVQFTKSGLIATFSVPPLSTDRIRAS